MKKNNGCEQCNKLTLCSNKDENAYGYCSRFEQGHSKKNNYKDYDLPPGFADIFNGII